METWLKSEKILSNGQANDPNHQLLSSQSNISTNKRNEFTQQLEKMSVKLRFHLVLPPQQISHFLHSSVEARAPTDVMFDFYTCADETAKQWTLTKLVHPCSRERSSLSPSQDFQSNSHTATPTHTACFHCEREAATLSPGGRAALF